MQSGTEIFGWMNTGENIQGLRKIVDFTRLISIFILAIHFYIVCYQAFAIWDWTVEITDKIIGSITKIGCLSDFSGQLVAMLSLVVSLIGVKGKKDEKIMLKPILMYIEFFNHY
jgi:hypothetical protein